MSTSLLPQIGKVVVPCILVDDARRCFQNHAQARRSHCCHGPVLFARSCPSHRGRGRDDAGSSGDSRKNNSAAAAPCHHTTTTTRIDNSWWGWECGWSCACRRFSSAAEPAGADSIRRSVAGYGPCRCCRRCATSAAAADNPSHAVSGGGVAVGGG